MRARILFGAGAWLLGAVTATGGSLLAVSLLGRGIAAGPSQQQLTSEAVNRALASELAERPVSNTGDRPAVAASSRPRPRASRPPASPSAQPTAGALLTSAGGTVVAGCASGGAYLVSWSPQQGYEATAFVRGPAVHAQVTFRSSWDTVTMVVTCSSGVPTATSSIRRHTGDD